MRIRTNQSTKVTSANGTTAVTVLNPPTAPSTRQAGYVTVVYRGTDSGSIPFVLLCSNAGGDFAIAQGVLTASAGTTAGQYFEGDLRHAFKSTDTMKIKLTSAIVNGSIDVVVSYLDQEGF